MEEINTAATTDNGFWEKVDWSLIANNKIGKEDFYRIKAKHKKVYSTLLGAQDALSFFMFKPMMWPEYKEIRNRGLDKYETQEFIINNCVVWPKVDIVSLNTLEAGIMITLVYQIMATSYFLTDPNSALSMILET